MTMATAAVVEGLPNPPEKYQLKINKSDGVHNYLYLASFKAYSVCLLIKFACALFPATSMHSGANWRLTNGVGWRIKTIRNIFLPVCPSVERVTFNAVEFSPYPTDALARTCEHAETYMKHSTMFVQFLLLPYCPMGACPGQYGNRNSTNNNILLFLYINGTVALIATTNVKI